MKLLNGTWLLHMMDASADNPAAKLLSVYSCLNAWLMAPGIRESFIQGYVPGVPLADSCPDLATHLIALATEAKIASPPTYVAQMFILLQGAIAEELRNPGSGALLKAQDAARCIMESVKPRPSAKWKQTLLVSSSAISTVALCFLAVFMATRNTSISGMREAQLAEAPLQAQVQPVMSPDLMGRTVALKENFDTGTCPAPQLINMPPDRVSAYINVMNTNFSDKSAMDSQKLSAFLSWYDKYMAWECKTENQKIVLGMK